MLRSIDEIINALDDSKPASYHIVLSVNPAHSPEFRGEFMLKYSYPDLYHPLDLQKSEWKYIAGNA